MSQVHWVPSISVKSGGNELIGRDFRTGTTTAAHCAIAAAKAVLQVAPDHEREKPRIDFQPSSMGDQLPQHSNERIEQERSYGSAAKKSCQIFDCTHARFFKFGVPASEVVAQLTSCNRFSGWLKTVGGGSE